jgi:hypothetical protein
MRLRQRKWMRANLDEDLQLSLTLPDVGDGNWPSA